MPGLQSQRLVNKADFERLLAARSAGRSAHFAVHHVAGVPQPAARRPAGSAAQELSTGSVEQTFHLVDDLGLPSPRPSAAAAARQLWMGCVVPKRHARRSVTRSLLKRQMRCAVDRHSAVLPAGLWLVRLHAPFAAGIFVSARSAALAAAARAELDSLMQSAQRRLAGAAR